MFWGIKKEKARMFEALKKVKKKDIKIKKR